MPVSASCYLLQLSALLML